VKVDPEINISGKIKGREPRTGAFPFSGIPPVYAKLEHLQLDTT
jgi:hypothetical protein